MRFRQDVPLQREPRPEWVPRALGLSNKLHQRKLTRHETMYVAAIKRTRVRRFVRVFIFIHVSIKLMKLRD